MTLGLNNCIQEPTHLKSPQVHPDFSFCPSSRHSKPEKRSLFRQDFVLRISKTKYFWGLHPRSFDPGFFQNFIRSTINKRRVQGFWLRGPFSGLEKGMRGEGFGFRVPWGRGRGLALGSVRTDRFEGLRTEDLARRGGMR